MKERLNPMQVAPAAYKAMLGLQAYVNGAKLEHDLVELVKIRASQINGCAFCLNMHASDARKAGETEARVWLLSAWRESPVYTDRERAALEWTEAVTLVADTHVPEAAWEAARRHFSEAELVDLTMAIIAINGWNRLSVAFGRLPEVRAGQ